MNDLEFKRWLRFSEKRVISGIAYYVLEAELLTKEEMYNQWLKHYKENTNNDGIY